MGTTKILLALLATAAFLPAAQAASSGTLLLQGTVGMVNDISVAANGTDNVNLNILAGETAKTVGTATETSNDLNGYKIFISSSTGGELRNTADSTKKTTYKVSYDGATSVTPTVAGVQVKDVTSLSALTVAASSIAVDVTAAPNAVAGTYQDTLTVSIQGN